jgi:hypothetical protein
MRTVANADPSLRFPAGTAPLPLQSLKLAQVPVAASSVKQEVPVTKLHFDPTSYVGVFGGTVVSQKEALVGGTFALVPPNNPKNWRLYMAGGPLISTLLEPAKSAKPTVYQQLKAAQKTLEVAAKSRMKTLGATAAYPVAVVSVNAFTLALQRGDARAALAAWEFGLGGSTALNIGGKGGVVFFYNLRANATNTQLSFNAGFYVNAGGWATQAAEKLSQVGMRVKAERRVGAVSSAVNSFAKAAAQFGNTTGSKVQVGMGGRVETEEVTSLSRFKMDLNGQTITIDLKQLNPVTQ